MKAPSPCKCRLFHVDAFTHTVFKGNPVAVIVGADGLGDELLVALARELSMADVVFLLQPQVGQRDVGARYFTRGSEVGFTAHAGIAAYFVWARITDTTSGILARIEEPHPFSVEVRLVAGDLQVVLVQTAPMLGQIFLNTNQAEVLDALGISAPSLHPDCPVQIMERRARRLLVGLRSPDSLNTLRPDFEQLRRLTAHLGAEGYLVFAFGAQSAPLTTHSRLFYPAMGIAEDSVSGNAHGMLAAYLVAHGLLKPESGTARLRGKQGSHLGREGLVEVEVTCGASGIDAVRVIGSAVVVYEADLSI